MAEQASQHGENMLSRRELPMFYFIEAGEMRGEYPPRPSGDGIINRWPITLQPDATARSCFKNAIYVLVYSCG